MNENKRAVQFELTRGQERHLSALKEAFCTNLDAKYRKGAAEHGGNIWDKSVGALVDEALAECVDQLTYLMTLREALVRLLGKSYMSVVNPNPAPKYRPEPPESDESLKASEALLRARQQGQDQY